MNRAKKKDIRTICLYGIKVLFLLCIVFVIFEVFKYRANDTVKVLPLLITIVIVFSCLCLVKYFAEKYHNFFGKYLNIILIFYLLFTFILQIILGNQVRYTPMWDLGSVYYGAISWLEQGNIDAYADYFYYFPNNLGLLLLFRGYFTVVNVILGGGNGLFYGGSRIGKCDCNNVSV